MTEQGLSGVGGNWQTIDEQPDAAAVRQQDHLACVPACGEMLLRSRGVVSVNQAVIAEQAREGLGKFLATSAETVVRVMNNFPAVEAGMWIGACVEIESAGQSQLLNALVTTGVWAAEFRQPLSLGHMVVVDGIDELDRILIRDPWEGTRYKMEKSEFLSLWSSVVIYFKKQ
jgi:filamentous hemagglutinin